MVTKLMQKDSYMCKTTVNICGYYSVLYENQRSHLRVNIRTGLKYQGVVKYLDATCYMLMLKAVKHFLLPLQCLDVFLRVVAGRM